MSKNIQESIDMTVRITGVIDIQEGESGIANAIEDVTDQLYAVFCNPKLTVITATGERR